MYTDRTLRARVHRTTARGTGRDLACCFRSVSLLDGVRQSDTRAESVMTRIGFQMIRCTERFLQSRSRLHAQAQDRTDRDVKAADGSEDIHALHDCIDIGLSPAPPLKSRSLAP